MVKRLLLIVLALVALTSVTGGLVMALSSLLDPDRLGLPHEVQLPLEYLQGSPFTSYLVPGLLLAVVVGGLHTAAFVTTIRRQPSARS
ncbi:hypothetical protein AAHB33_08855 [Paenarthrobacter sp. S56]|uniref:hypothetical protein n=1 Tax=Paenarthrobacter sp. S56 TaxID=3138179 RepID=UPI00321B3169